MDRQIAAKEIEAFFRFISQLRAQIRASKPSARKIREGLDDVAVLAIHTKQPRLAVRCRSIIGELAPRFDYARELLREVDEHAATYG